MELLPMDSVASESGKRKECFGDWSREKQHPGEWEVSHLGEYSLVIREY